MNFTKLPQKMWSAEDRETFKFVDTSYLQMDKSYENLQAFVNSLYEVVNKIYNTNLQPHPINENVNLDEAYLEYLSTFNYFMDCYDESIGIEKKQRSYERFDCILAGNSLDDAIRSCLNH